MTAISRKHMNVLRAGINTLKERHLTLCQLGVTHDEFLELFAPPEHWELLKTAAEVASISAEGGTHYASLNSPVLLEHVGTRRVGLSFTVQTVHGKAPLLPRNTNVLHLNPALVEKVTQWVIQRTSIGLEYALATALLEWMNNCCDSPKQIRYLWPSLVALCALSPDTSDLGHKLRDTKPPQSLPAMPQEVKEACRSTARTIAIASLIGDEPAEVFSPAVRVELARVDVIKTMGVLGSINPT